jgi:hypothetical protein
MLALWFLTTERRRVGKKNTGLNESLASFMEFYPAARA